MNKGGFVSPPKGGSSVVGKHQCCCCCSPLLIAKLSEQLHSNTNINVTVNTTAEFDPKEFEHRLIKLISEMEKRGGVRV
ncbi:hypothetical protein BSK59_16215 [Paenibacillus odorifer]|uniref:hypothetical protein n=1 Tax=Paenibacillus odorifer TaxID=189426 RepID=UPI00096BFCDB|nr:hypothetical protein [Paenibacillus odorifer]OME54124.1 hypothetical protein BSK59_16215 [Paenibacillus odorifer]